MRHNDVEVDPVALRPGLVHLLEPDRRQLACRVNDRVLGFAGLVSVAEHGPPEWTDRADVHRVNGQLQHLRRTRVRAALRCGDGQAEAGQCGRDGVREFGVPARGRGLGPVLQRQLHAVGPQVDAQVTVGQLATGPRGCRGDHNGLLH